MSMAEVTHVHIEVGIKSGKVFHNKKQSVKEMVSEYGQELTLDEILEKIRDTFKEFCRRRDDLYYYEMELDDGSFLVVPGGDIEYYRIHKLCRS